MKLSIRQKILLPLVITVCVGVANTAIMAYQSITGQGVVAHVVDDALKSKMLAAEIRGQLTEVEGFISRVLSMTTFIPAKEVEAGFSTTDGALATSLATLQGLDVSEGLRGPIETLVAAHKAWEADARILLGLDPAQEVPTTEKLTREFKAVNNQIAMVDQLVDKAALDSVQGASADLEGKITLLMAVSIAVSLVGLVILVLIANGVAKPILGITASMRRLAGGDAEAPVPFLARRDEIGQMAQSVEIFRENALAQAALEADAEEMRRSAESRRVADQERAEREAAERLSVATSGLAAGLKRLASGDLAFRLTERFSPEFEALRDDFNTSVMQLANAMKAVAEGVSTIDGNTVEITGSASDIAVSTQRQAASLEETAAALSDVTGKVDDASQIAEQARKLAGLANVSAVSSADVVSRAVQAMGQIEASSSQISSIIGVIDQIAFQTNLLALNAGVEAARAGDAGKGFAVVAQEVRELAQRSAQAAKEIKGLIQQSGEDVEAGVHLVNQTGEALHSISGQIQQINASMETLAASSREQAASLHHVSSAVQQMDRVTQQNAAKVEQTEAATRLLAQETERLRGQVERFRLAEGQPQAGRRAA
jgi:methyl-accepting chemotaxis protein